jgi:hypothetical protein
MDSGNSSSTASIGAAEKEEQEPASLQNLDPLPPIVLGLLYALLPTSSLLALRCCSKVRRGLRDNACFLCAWMSRWGRTGGNFCETRVPDRKRGIYEDACQNLARVERARKDARQIG